MCFASIRREMKVSNDMAVGSAGGVGNLAFPPTIGDIPEMGGPQNGNGITEKEHTVQPGQNLTTITRQHGPENIAEVNGKKGVGAVHEYNMDKGLMGPNPDALAAGQTVIIPLKSSSAAAGEVEGEKVPKKANDPAADLNDTPKPVELPARIEAKGEGDTYGTVYAEGLNVGPAVAGGTERIRLTGGGEFGVDQGLGVGNDIALGGAATLTTNGDDAGHATLDLRAVLSGSDGTGNTIYSGALTMENRVGDGEDPRLTVWGLASNRHSEMEGKAVFEGNEVSVDADARFTLDAGKVDLDLTYRKNDAGVSTRLNADFAPGENRLGVSNVGFDASAVNQDGRQFEDASLSVTSDDVMGTGIDLTAGVGTRRNGDGETSNRLLLGGSYDVRPGFALGAQTELGDDGSRVDTVSLTGRPMPDTEIALKYRNVVSGSDHQMNEGAFLAVGDNETPELGDVVGGEVNFAYPLIQNWNANLSLQTADDGSQFQYIGIGRDLGKDTRLDIGFRNYEGVSGQDQGRLPEGVGITINHNR
jgi:hypothetical protein